MRDHLFRDLLVVVILIREGRDVVKCLSWRQTPGQFRKYYLKIAQGLT